MARGRGGVHKGGKRHFTNPDDLKAREERERKEREWRRRAGEISDSDEEEDEESEEDDSEEETSSGSDDGGKAKGVEKLIEVENPNRVVKKVNKKALEQVPVAGSSTTSAESSAPKTELSRREREELDKQRAKENYDKMHAAGKTDQARADLARLALIRQQREEAAKKRGGDTKVNPGTKPPATSTVNPGTKPPATNTVTVAAPVPSKKAAKK